MAAGFLFKQTAFSFAAVPPIVLLSHARKPSRSAVLLALVPPAVAAGFIVGLPIVNPALSH